MNGIIHDVRYAFRILLKTLIVSIVAIITLAFGIGVTTAIFTFVDAGLLRAVNFPESDRLMQVYMFKQGDSARIQAAYPTYVDWRNQNTVFSSIAGYSGNGTTMHTATGVELVTGGLVTDNFFQTLGVQPERGSWFHPGPSAAHEIVISHGFAQRLFGGSAAVGQSLTMQNFAGNDEPYTVVGITPPDFEFAPLGQAEFFTLPPATGFLIERRNHALEPRREGMLPRERQDMRGDHLRIAAQLVDIRHTLGIGVLHGIRHDHRQVAPARIGAKLLHEVLDDGAIEAIRHRITSAEPDVADGRRLTQSSFSAADRGLAGVSLDAPVVRPFQDSFYRVGVFGKANATYAPGMGAVDAGCPGIACVCVVARAAAQ